MRIMSPEKCGELLGKHVDVIQSSTAKLQVILEFFDKLSLDQDRHEFKDLAQFSEGVATICDEIIDGLWECEITDIIEHINLLSPDPVKVIKHVEYLKSIGIHTENTNIELEG